jgi:hypothetical protein
LGPPLEDTDPAEAVKQADAALQVAAMRRRDGHPCGRGASGRSLAGHLIQEDGVGPTYGNGYAPIASHLVINRRYQEGVAYIGPSSSIRGCGPPDRSSYQSHATGSRGRTTEAAGDVLQQRFRDAATVNSLRLLDSYKNFDFWDAT